MRIKKGISVIVTVFNKEKFIEKTILLYLEANEKKITNSSLLMMDQLIIHQN